MLVLDIILENLNRLGINENNFLVIVVISSPEVQLWSEVFTLLSFEILLPLLLNGYANYAFMMPWAVGLEMV